ncbi:CbiQ family ECF transporter T component [Ferrimonas lipolytica]|uniref:Energy-coupling factor transporter transmembrane protein EcfT n=1 Tax=Ferrimonas lipolytica TaxID=2724191 RepID=A0A6H1UIR6_9GAMM|nr:CbiQ family ECF transporter T component [Ferrimonas lipolytica]QIZ78718.1 energy-coupling factor transporter transmembrane protein EcfT [Ferrimonas lipolytica]
MHPFTGFILWLWYSVSAFMLPLGPASLLALALPMLALFGNPDGRQRLSWLLQLLLPLALGLWLIHSQILAYCFGTIESWHWPWPATTLWLRIATSLVVAQLWFSYCPLPRLIAALFASRLPLSLSYLLAGPLLLLDPIKRQIAQIRQAQLARGVPLDGTLWQRSKAAPALLMPLLNSLLQGVGQQGAMLEMRGFRHQAQRTRRNAPLDPIWQQQLRWGIAVVMLLQLLGALLWR